MVVIIQNHLQVISHASTILRKCSLTHQHILDKQLLKAHQLLTATDQLLQSSVTGPEVSRYLLCLLA